MSGKRIAQASGRDLGQTDDNDQVGVIQPSVTQRVIKMIPVGSQIQIWMSDKSKLDPS